MSEDKAGAADFAVAIDYLRSIVVPLQESMTAARKIGQEQSELTGQFKQAGDEEVTSAAMDFLNSWSYGMQQLVELSESITQNLDQTIRGYEESEQAIRDGFTSAGGDGGTGNSSAGPVSDWIQEAGVDQAPSLWGTVKEVFE